MSNKHFVFHCLLIFCIGFSSSTALSQEKEAEESVIETENVIADEITDETTKTKFVANDSLAYLNDTSTLVQHRKFESNFKQKYKDDEAFDYDQVIIKDSIWKRIKEAIANWFQENIFAPINYGLNRSTTQFVVTVVAVFLFGFIIFYLIRAYIQKDLYWLIRKKSKEFISDTKLSEVDITTTNFDELIAFNIQEKEYRIAIRLYYLWLLQLLQNENKIVWNAQKTNADYLYEIKDLEDKAIFSYLSYLYNTIWYGEYQVSESDFFKAKQSFDERLKNSKQ